jgi:uncharacterized protein YqgC (DUF456 family)
MSTAESNASHEEAHGPDHVHVYESGISEGNARVPPWLLAILISLFSFAAYYIAANWNAQPSSARVK